MNGSTDNTSIGRADREIGDVAIECETLANELSCMNPKGTHKQEDGSEKSIAPATMKAFVEVAKVIPKTNTRGRKPKEHD